MLNIALMVGGILLAAVLGFAVTRPDRFRVERTTRIQAPPERVFEWIQDFHRWSAWSPYEKLDPALKKTFTGASSGKGAVYEWAGNRKAGEGRMEILETSAPSRVQIQLDFRKPFEGHNMAEFTLAAKAGGTELTWATYGPQPFMVKLMTLFLSMDKLVGKEFEEGLANIKGLAEGHARAATVPGR